MLFSTLKLNACLVTRLTFKLLPDPNFCFQYAEHFAGCLVDARLLDHLSKKDLEKYLGKLYSSIKRKEEKKIDARVTDKIYPVNFFLFGFYFSGVTRKFHMASIAHGVHLLRMVGYDRQVSF